MNRSSSMQALVLAIKTLGESNSSVTFLTPERGIIYATLYGGPKSKLRSLVSLYNSGKLWIYETPEKKQIKITDFEVLNFHSSFTQNLFKLYAASLVSEIAIKTHCAGSNEECFKYLSGFLDGMDLCNEEQSRLGLMRFLWRYLILLGVNPDVEVCEHCGKTLQATNDSKFDMYNFSYYNRIDGNILCGECAKSSFSQNDFSTFLIPLSFTVINYLQALTKLTPAEVRQIRIDKSAYEQIRELIFFLIGKNIEQKLNTIETGAGIL